MAIESLRIPQIGEGLQEARLVAVLKKPGEHVKRDEPIYQMETDKAVMDVESPFEGTLLEWLAEADDVLAIGAEVGRIEVAGAVAAAPVSAAPVASEAVTIPPRSRAYAKEKGIADEDLAKIPAPSGKLMPADIDAYLGSTVAEPKESKPSRPATDHALPGKQRVLNARMVRGNQVVVPGTMSVVVKWASIEHARAEMKAKHDGFNPSAFTIFAYAVAQTVKDFPGMRTVLANDETARTFDHLSLGIAVGLPGDELVLAVVEEADTLSWRDFAAKAREAIDLARTGKDQAHEADTLSRPNLQSHGLRDAVPVVVPPSVATLFLGEVYASLDSKTLQPIHTANMALTFDHRVLNGVGAANFMNALRAKLEAAEELVG